MSDGTREACGIPNILVYRTKATVDGIETWFREGRLAVDDCPVWCDGAVLIGAELVVPEDGPFPYHGSVQEVRGDWCSSLVVGTTSGSPNRCPSEGDHLSDRPCDYVGLEGEGEIEVRELSDSLLDATLMLPLASDTYGNEVGGEVLCDTGTRLECIGKNVEPAFVTLTINVYIPLVDVGGEGWVPRGSGGTEGL